MYDKYLKPGGPIFFYFGNEDFVDLYVNHTGLVRLLPLFVGLSSHFWG